MKILSVLALVFSVGALVVSFLRPVGLSEAEVDARVGEIVLERELKLVREMAPRFEEMFEGGYERAPESLEELLLPLLKFVQSMEE